MLLLNEWVGLLAAVLLVSFLGIGSIWVLEVSVFAHSRVVPSSNDGAELALAGVGATVVFCCSILEANSSEIYAFFCSIYS